ncbi:AMP-binding protein [Ilumatobacter sp.]|uniref:AMP-binding protein n=1 Tax=Ilumatobacter sp. TaxID=1967498 RepID=UPI003B51E9CD
MFPGAHLETRGDSPAVTMAESGFTQTYAELDAAANRLSRLLRSAGLNPGDHVAICLENHDRYLEIVGGCHYAGLIYTCASSRLGSAELEYVLTDCGARAYITSMHKAEQAAEVAASTPAVELRLMLDGTIDGYDSYEDAVRAHPGEPLDEERVAGMDMLYSSGTTGMPKGIARDFPNEPLETWNNGVTTICQLLFGMDADTRYLSPAPFYHAAPLRFCMSQHALGASIVAMENFDAERYLQLVDEHRITHSQVVPTMFIRMLKLEESVRSSYDVSSLQAVIHAAAPCPVPTKKAMMDWFGPVIHEYYAGSEGNGFVYASPEGWLAHEGTVGTPINCTLHICDEEGEEVPVGSSGTIFFDGGGTFEYHNDPDKTRASRHPKGWSTLGDVGYLDEDGYLYLTDRKAFMIISGGVNIYPQEAENVLVTHDDVIDVAVFGVPNEDFGEEVKAVVQPREMPADDDAARELAGELIRFCRSKLADVKCPRSIDFRPDLPRHPTGKLYKRILKDEYWSAAGRSI